MTLLKIKLSDEIKIEIQAHAKRALLMQTSMNSILDCTKTSLYYGNRIVIGTLLPIIDDNDGFLGTHQVQNDALVLTPRIEQAI